MTAGSGALLISLPHSSALDHVAAPSWLPWPLESYIDGVHRSGQAAILDFSDFSLDGVRIRWSGGWISAFSDWAGAPA